MASKNTVTQNKNASIRTRNDRNGNIRTETFGRDDDSLNIAVSTDPRTEATRVFIDTSNGVSYNFDGRMARTLYRALQKHYRNTDKSW